MNEVDVRLMLEAHCTPYGNARKIADQLGITEAYISQVRSGRKFPSRKLLTYLGVRRVVSYEPIEKGS